MFNPSTFGSSGSSFSGFGLSTTTPATANPMKDFEVSIFCFTMILHLMFILFLNFQLEESQLNILE